MAKTVPFSFDELGMIIEYFINHGRNGKMWAALVSMMYLTGCRISEVLELKIGQIADRKFKIHPIIQPVKLKSSSIKNKKLLEVGADSEPGQMIEQWIIDNCNIPDGTKFVLKIEAVNENKKKVRSTRTIDIDTKSPLVGIIEVWLKQARQRYLRISKDDYVFSVRMTGAPVLRTSAYKAFTRAYKKLRLDYVSRGTHAIRKTAGLSHYQTGLEETGDGFRAMQLVQGFYDHQSAKTTEKYLPLLEEVKKEFATRHSARLNIGNILT